MMTGDNNCPIDKELAERIMVERATTQLAHVARLLPDNTGNYDKDMLLALDALDEEGMLAAFLNLPQSTRETITLWAALCAVEENDEELEAAIQCALIQGFMKGYDYRDRGRRL